MPFIETADTRIYYEEEGAGTPLVCIAGLAAAHDAWELVRGKLAKSFRVIVFDNRGVGKTSSPDGRFDIVRMADDTAALMGALGLQGSVIAGHSMGSAIAMTLALKYPQQVGSVILCNPFARMRPRSAAAFRANARLLDEGVSAPRLFPVIMPWLFSSGFLADDVKVRTLLDIITTMPVVQTPKDFGRQLDAVTDFDIRGKLGRIHQPALLIAGADDILTPAEDARGMAACMPDARLEILPTGHMSIVEEPAECISLIRKFGL